MTQTQKTNLNKLRKVFNSEDPYKNMTFKNLEERKDLIVKEWTSKKGREFVMYNNNGMNLQLEKRMIKYYKVSNETNEIIC